MLKQVAEGVLTHQSGLLENNTVVVQGRGGVLLVRGRHARTAGEGGLEGPRRGGAAAGADEVRARIEQDRAYVHAVRDAGAPDDPRLGPAAKPGWEWVSDVHEGQFQHLARRGARDRPPD